VNSKEPTQRRAAEEIYQTCLGLGLDTLFDDRDERPGVKFKDADLIGIPFRITVGKKLAQGMVELVDRREKKSADVSVVDAAAQVKKRAAEQTVA
jgi:prolyl-tRNA synthetase